MFLSEEREISGLGRLLALFLEVLDRRLRFGLDGGLETHRLSLLVREREQALRLVIDPAPDLYMSR